MDERQLALCVLSAGIKLGCDGIRNLFGNEVIELVRQTYGELHKNNLPEEELIFIMKKATDKAGIAVPVTSDIDSNVTIEQIHDEIRQLETYKSEKRMPEIDDFRQKSVIKDFVYYLSKQFFYRDKVFTAALVKFQSAVTNRSAL